MNSRDDGQKETKLIAEFRNTLRTSLLVGHRCSYDGMAHLPAVRPHPVIRAVRDLHFPAALAFQACRLNHNPRYFSRTRGSQGGRPPSLLRTVYKLLVVKMFFPMVKIVRLSNFRSFSSVFTEEIRKRTICPPTSPVSKPGMKDYPDIKGTSEIHIFLKPLNPAPEVVEAYNSAVPIYQIFLYVHICFVFLYVLLLCCYCCDCCCGGVLVIVFLGISVSSGSRMEYRNSAEPLWSQHSYAPGFSLPQLPRCRRRPCHAIGSSYRITGSFLSLSLYIYIHIFIYKYKPVTCSISHILRMDYQTIDYPH
jgi:hypothetical protein